MLPAWLEALVLGVVQGLTEFIPVSSSGHLVLVPYLAGWDKHGLAFDVMLHVGTLGAVLLYFRAELLAMARGLLGRDRTPEGLAYRRVALLLVPGSVPVAAVGLLLKDQVEAAFASPLVAAVLLLVTAALLLSLEHVRSRRVAAAGAVGAAGAGPVDREIAAAAREGRSAAVETGPDGRPAVVTDVDEDGTPVWDGSWRQGQADDAAVRREVAVELPLGVDLADPRGADLSRVTLKQVLVAGAFQSLAVLPGISRSGATLAGGVFAGLTREAATRLSFLLAIPALIGATVLSLPDVAEGDATAVELVIGVVAAFVSGYAAVSFLVRLVSRERLNGFAYYCIAASAVGIIGYLFLGPPSSV